MSEVLCVLYVLVSAVEVWALWRMLRLKVAYADSRCDRCEGTSHASYGGWRTTICPKCQGTGVASPS